jgi:hypothetical protein
MHATNHALRIVAGVFAVVGLSSAPAGAQAPDDTPLAQVLPNLVLGEIVLQRGSIGPPHQAHFTPLTTNELNNPVVGIVQGFNSQMATQFATFPLGSSTGGLTYVFDESLGTFRRGSASFGPLFAERALTIGRHKLSAGFNYQRTSYNTFEGQKLDDGSIKFYLRHQDCCHFDDPVNLAGFTTTPLNGNDRLNPPFKGDIIEAALSLEATTHTTAAFANFGLTDRWDVGIAVPFVSVSLDARVLARVIRLVTEGFATHVFEVDNLEATRTVEHNGSASGIGDIVLRTKYNFLRGSGGGLAAAVDVRLPTGDENELLGAGGAQGKFLLVMSSERGRLGQHVNIGYTAAGGDVAGTATGLTPASLPDEINYSGGLEFVASPRLTLIGDIVGRTLRGAGRLELVSRGFEHVDVQRSTIGTGAPGCGGFLGAVCTTTFFDEFDPQSGNLTLLLGTGGVKFNPFGNLLISGSVLFPLTNAGLRSRLTTVIGVDYAF